MMESLTSYDRPLYGRPSREVVVEPLGPADVAGCWRSSDRDVATFRAIADRAAVSDASLTQALTVLAAKRVIAVEDPLSTTSSRRLRRYRVADPYLRFWLRFIGPRLDDLERGRPELATRPLWSGWAAYRGLAVEPLVRDGIARLLPDARFGGAQRVGSW